MHKPESADGKLGVLLPGMGAVATTFLAGVAAVNQGLAKPVGSFVEMGHLPVGDKHVQVRDALPIASLKDIEFGGWDIYQGSCYDAATQAQVLEPHLLSQIKTQLDAIKPMPAVFRNHYVKRLNGENVKKGTWWECAQQVQDDIANFSRTKNTKRNVMVWCGSTEVYQKETAAHQSVRSFEEAMKADDEAITPSMVYAYAALKSGVPFANGAPNLTTDIPAMHELAHETHTPICGKDFKTGQTLMKTVVAPGLQARLLGLNGWFSTNILGNRDGQVLDDPDSFKTKEVSKLSVLDSLLDAKRYPDLYGDYMHKVRIEYYPPRGDNKEGWDNIDIFGWLGYPMQIKINFLCRDSILAAPIVLDLALLMDLAKRAGGRSVQEWLSFYFKAPMTAKGEPEHDLFVQQQHLFKALQSMIA